MAESAHQMSFSKDFFIYQKSTGTDILYLGQFYLIKDHYIFIGWQEYFIYCTIHVLNRKHKKMGEKISAISKCEVTCETGEN